MRYPYILPDMGEPSETGSPDRLTERLARCLRELRHRAGWSLDELTDRCGVSRATLSRLEHAEVSPTAQALCRIARAYDMPASHLIRLAEVEAPEVLPREAQPVSAPPGEGSELRIVSPGQGGFAAEVSEGWLLQDTELTLPAAHGSELHIVLIDGRLSVSIDGGDHDLRKGDSLRIHRDGPALLRAASRRGARFMLFSA